MTVVRLALAGVGNVGQSFLELLRDKGDLVRDRYGLDLRLILAADRSGAAVDPAGLDPAGLLVLKHTGHGVATGQGGRPGATAAEALTAVEADVLLEATLTDLHTGQPGLDLMCIAFEHGMHVVSANKGPLVLAYRELTGRAAQAGRQLRFSGAVCAGLPTINIGRRDLVAAQIDRVEGIFNSTTNYILESMSANAAYETALAEAQRMGFAEADPSLDVQGWDTANKLVIIANSVLNYPARLDEVEVTGMTLVTPGALQAAQAGGRKIKLLATALRRPDGSYRLRVAPTPLPIDHFLAQTSGWEMGIVYYTDIYGVLSAKVDERGPLPTGSAMLRDVIDIYQG